MADDIDISPAVALSESDAPRIEALLPQLSSTATFSLDRLRTLIAAPDSHLFLAREQDRIVGMATLATFPLVTGWRGIVEDVVVDRRARGRGIARLLLTAIIDESTRRRLRTLDLTSRPERESAIRLYESLGFERRETNVLRWVPAPA